MNILTPLENQVMGALLAGEDEVLSILRQQLKQATISSRKMTGVGFFTKFYIPAECTRVAGNSSFKLGDVNGTANNLNNGLGFLLFVTNGEIDALEGYTYDEPWPIEVQGLTLTYAGGQNRDMDVLKKIFRN
jgi:hypothetical protein